METYEAETWHCETPKYKQARWNWGFRFDLEKESIDFLINKTILATEKALKVIDKSFFTPTVIDYITLSNFGKSTFRGINAIDIDKESSLLQKINGTVNKLTNSNKYGPKLIFSGFEIIGKTKLILIDNNNKNYDFVLPKNKDDPFPISLEYKIGYFWKNPSYNYFNLKLNTYCDIWFHKKKLPFEDNSVLAKLNGGRLRAVIKSISTALNIKSRLEEKADYFIDADDGGPIVK